MRNNTVVEYDKEDYDKVEDELTIDKVIERLKRIARGWLPDYNFTGKENDYENYVNQMTMAKAIEWLSELKGVKET